MALNPILSNYSLTLKVWQGGETAQVSLAQYFCWDDVQSEIETKIIISSNTTGATKRTMIIDAKKMLLSASKISDKFES